MNERLALIIKAKDITPAQLADELGVQRSGISHILNGRNNPSLDFVQKLLKLYPDISTQWFLYGEGPMMNPYPSSSPVPEKRVQESPPKPKPFIMELFPEEDTEETVQPVLGGEKVDENQTSEIEDQHIIERNTAFENTQKEEPEKNPEVSSHKERPQRHREVEEKTASVKKEPVAELSKEKPPVQHSEGRRLVKIVMFYSDKTFSEFIPED